MSEVLLEARGMVKRYAGIVALDDVTFQARRGCINVLIGENGAGKSTLMRILSGVEAADEGEVLLEGQRVELRSPREAAARGIAIVHQELAVLPNLDVSDNIFAGRELRRGGAMVDRGREDTESGAALRRLQHPMALKTTLSQLSLGSRQMVELARVVAHGAKVLILDEPTSALSMAEAEALFGVLRELKEAGVTMIYISHRLQELMHLGDTFTVLRGGRVVGEGVRGEVTREWIVERMSGRDATEQHGAAPEREGAATVLRGERIAVAPRSDDAAASPVWDFSFALREGEVLGIYGLLGAGRSELLEALAGARRLTAGTVEMRGAPLRVDSVGAAVKAGIALVPEDRQRDGLIPELSVRENIALAAAGGVMLSRADETRRAKELVAQLRIAVRDLELPVTALSGGNQQKVLLARCLMRNPKVLLLDEPTRGVDVGAKAEIYEQLRALARGGLSVLFTSSEIEEVRALADRALVMCQGRNAAEFSGGAWTDEELFRAASPAVRSDAAMATGAMA